MLAGAAGVADRLTMVGLVVDDGMGEQTVWVVLPSTPVLTGYVVERAVQEDSGDEPFGCASASFSLWL